MDGKHIVIKQPKNLGSYYFNYKDTFRVVLLVLVDANYKFIYIDVGCNGRISDGSVYRNSSLSKAIENCLQGKPPPPIELWLKGWKLCHMSYLLMMCFHLRLIS